MVVKNEEETEVVSHSQAVAMDGMNTKTPGGSSRSVGMDGMNKEMKGGGLTCWWQRQIN